MDYAENLLRSWAFQDGLTALHITADFDLIGDPLRLWWFFSDLTCISPGEGLCDEEVILFFSKRHELTFVDRLLFDQQLSINH